jgi:hypothetical protein
MVMLYVGDKLVGRLPEDAGLLAEHVANGRAVEVRDEAGGRLGRFVPDVVPPDDPLVLSPEELERRLTGEFLSYDEFKKRLGWA